MNAAKLAVYVVRASRQDKDHTRLIILLLVAFGTRLIKETPSNTPTVYLKGGHNVRGVVHETLDGGIIKEVSIISKRVGV